MATQRRAGTQKRQRKGSGRSGAARPSVDAARRDQSPDAVTSSSAAGSVAVAPRRSGRGSAETPSSARSEQRGRGGSAKAAWAARGEGLRKVIADTRSELRRVNWPDKETTQNLTLVVIAISIALGFLLGGIDYVLFQLFEALT